MQNLEANKVLTLGTFDLLHYGHVDFLERCATLGALTVAVNSDEFASTFKDAPIMSQTERTYAVAQLGYRTILNDSAGKELIKEEHPDVIAVGSDWARKDYLKQIDMTQDQLDGLGITLAYVPRDRWKPMSSTEIRRRIHER